MDESLPGEIEDGNQLRSIKLFYIVDSLRLGGTENQLVSTINLLDSSAFELHLCCLRSGDGSLDRRIACRQYTLGVLSFGSLKAILRFFWLVRLLRRQKADIVQTFFIDATLFGVLAAKIAGVKHIISCRRDMGFWYTRGILLKLRVINHLVDRFLVNAVAVKNHIRKMEKIPEKRIDIIYNGIDLDSFSRMNESLRRGIRRGLGVSDNELVVGIVSNLNRAVKRVDIFIRAAALVLKERPGVWFWVIGEGQMRVNLCSLCRDLGIDSRVRFLGLQREVIPYLSTFDVAVNSSDSEGLSNALLEYMAAGIPVVATHAGGNSELIHHGTDGLLVPPGRPLAMAKAILMLLNDERLRYRIGSSARQEIRQRYSAKAMIKTLEEYYARNVLEAGTK